MALRFSPARGAASIVLSTMVRGPAGSKGETGDQGQQGNTGAQGAQGEQGIQGETGDTGATGSTGPGYAATSATANAIDVGELTFTTQAGLAYSAGQRAYAVSAANPNKWIEGPVSSYTGTTLVIDADLYSGSGSVNDWNIGLGGSTTYALRLYDLLTHTAGGGL